MKTIYAMLTVILLVACGTETQKTPTTTDPSCSGAQPLCTGETGPAGPRGEKGDVGPVGPQGVPGQTGSTGPQGSPGQAGSTGPQGSPGSAGPQGIPGSVGPAGPAGASGGVTKTRLYTLTGPNSGTYVTSFGTNSTADLFCSSKADAYINGGVIYSTNGQHGEAVCTPLNVSNVNAFSGVHCELYSSSSQVNWTIWVLCSTP